MKFKKGQSPIEGMFELFSTAPMNARKYVAKKPIPQTVTAPLAPQDMENLQIIAARIGASRVTTAHHILKLGIAEALAGCGFTCDEDGKISEEQLVWDTTPRQTGLGFIQSEGEEA